MKSTKSGLFQVKNSKIDPLIQEKIESLRKEARSYQVINDALVDKKWDIDVQIVRSKSPQEKKNCVNNKKKFSHKSKRDIM